MSTEPNLLSSRGSRRLTLAMMAVRNQADLFEGVARGSAKPLRFLAAFQEAEPYLDLPPQAFKLVAWLVKMTKAQDWEAGSRPIAWPSALRQQEFLGLTPSAVKVINRALFEAGIFVLRDSPTGKRYGRRDDQGRIIEAYGFDLSPLAFRADEFVRLAAEARAERERMARLKRRATCARRAVAQIGATLAEAGGPPCDWPALAAAAADLVKTARKARTADELDGIVRALEARKAEAETLVIEAGKSAGFNPREPANKPHTIITNLKLDPPDTVAASEEGGAVDLRAEGQIAHPAAAAERGKGTSRSGHKPPARIHPGELLQLAPRLAEHVARPFPDWPDIVNAAGEGLRLDLGVSSSLWGEACVVVGRQTAAIALAVVSTKPSNHFTRGAGGYFAAMIKRAESGALNLERSLWKLRRDRLDQIERNMSGGPARLGGSSSR